ncbi:unnamed protein product, partial [Polarella glacialis]
GAAMTCVRRCDLTWVLLLHGSSGLTWTSWRWAAKIAELGMGVLAPDSFAHAPGLGLRHRDGLERLEGDDPENTYWAEETLYTSRCSWEGSGGRYPFCYSTEVENVLRNAEGWKEYYERVFLLRRRELDFLVSQRLPEFLGATAKKLFMWCP